MLPLLNQQRLYAAPTVRPIHMHSCAYRHPARVFNAPKSAVRHIVRASVATAAAGAAQSKDSSVRDSDAVKVLHEPPSDTSPICDIILFHGSSWHYCPQYWQETWTNADGVLWPQAWLQQDFPLARIACVSYDFSFIAGTMTPKDIGSNLLARLCSTQLRVGQGKRPVLLIGHSMGGIILKQLCCQAAADLREVSMPAGAPETETLSARAQFASNVAGAFFFATPHGGSPFTGALSLLADVLSRKGPVLETLAELGRLKENAPINKAFNDLYSRKVELACTYETQPPGTYLHSNPLFNPIALVLAALASFFVGAIMALWVVPLVAPALTWSAAMARWLPAWLTAQRALGMMLGACVGFLADLCIFQHKLIVDRASAVLGMDEDRICALQADHFNTARPEDCTSDAYIHLRGHIKRCLTKYYKGKMAGEPPSVKVEHLRVALEQVPFSLWLDTEFSRPCYRDRIGWEDFWEVLIEQLINSDYELHYPEMWEFRDQRLDKAQHQQLFQLAISGSTKQWVPRKQLLEAVNGAGIADVMNAAMNSAWTHWLPGKHLNCSGTLTMAAHAPLGEMIVRWKLGLKDDRLVALQGVTDRGTRLEKLPANADEVVEDWVEAAADEPQAGTTSEGMTRLWGTGWGSSAGLLGYGCAGAEPKWEVDSRAQLGQKEGYVVGYQMRIGGGDNDGRFRFLFRDFAAPKPAACAAAASSDLLKLRHQAFLSHTGRDKDLGTVSLVAAIKDRLQDRRVPAFLDARVLQPAAPFAPSLELGLVASKVVVVIVSPNYFTRYWCMRELDLAFNAEPKGRVIVPVLLGVARGYFATAAALKRYWQRWAVTVQKHPERAATVNSDRWTNNVRMLAKLEAYNTASFGAAAGDKNWEAQLAEVVAELVARKMSDHDVR